jgi:hypothetical protein
LRSSSGTSARGRSGVMRIERSAALPSPGEAGRAGVPAWRGLPHCPQNLKVGGFSNPQWEQRLAKGAAQLPQNFMPSGFSNPHFEQDCTLQNLFGFPATTNRYQIARQVPPCAAPCGCGSSSAVIDVRDRAGFRIDRKNRCLAERGDLNPRDPGASIGGILPGFGALFGRKKGQSEERRIRKVVT